jgi:diguanylate cyclase (GGDEF)-like protein
MNVFDEKKLTEKKEQKQVKKHTIMVVDDEEKILQSMKSLLAKNYNVITAKSGREALNIIKKMEYPKKISLFISDQRMPEMTGIELFEEVKHIIPDTIRVILTGFDDKEVMLAAINEAKVYEFILKPIEPEELRHRVKRCIEVFELRKKGELIFIDPLTALYNARYLEKYVPQIVKEVNRYYKEDNQNNTVACMLLDLDDFKKVNKTYGHPNGSKVLKEFSKILKDVCRGADILARYGGDEFIGVFRFTDGEGAMKLTERLLQVLKEHPFDLGNNQKPKITCSIGIACYPFIKNDPQKLNWEQVVNIADKALYKAKDLGRNCSVGLFSTEKTEPENLYQRIQENIGKLIDKDELEFRTSITDKPIIWTKKK